MAGQGLRENSLCVPLSIGITEGSLSERGRSGGRGARGAGANGDAKRNGATGGDGAGGAERDGGTSGKRQKI